MNTGLDIAIEVLKDLGVTTTEPHTQTLLEWWNSISLFGRYAIVGLCAFSVLVTIVACAKDGIARSKLEGAVVWRVWLNESLTALTGAAFFFGVWTLTICACWLCLRETQVYADLNETQLVEAMKEGVRLTYVDGTENTYLIRGMEKDVLLAEGEVK